MPAVGRARSSLVHMDDQRSWPEPWVCFGCSSCGRAEDGGSGTQNLARQDFPPQCSQTPQEEATVS